MKLHPKIKVREYEAIKDTDAFLFQTTWICDDCFLTISTTLCEEIAGIQRHERSKSENKVLPPIRQPFSAQARYAVSISNFLTSEKSNILPDLTAQTNSP